MNGDQHEVLVEQVQQAFAEKQALRIVGGSSKLQLGRAVEGEPLDVTKHTGIVEYLPTELVITARAGMPLKEIETVLAESGQMLPFEPPHLGENATLGGTIACGLSGPRRPFAGSARDFVLGAKLINGRGELMQFGGQVMKNVAGYDVSRLQVGAQGTLGVLLEVSLKVLPRPLCERTLRVEMDAAAAIDTMSHLSGSALPLTAACHLPVHESQVGQLCLRLSGAEAAVIVATGVIQKELSAFAVLEINDDEQAHNFWCDLRERQLSFFDEADALWRLSVPPASPDFCGTDVEAGVAHPSFRCRPESSGLSSLDSGLRRNDGKQQTLAHDVSLPGNCLLDWAGAQRWLKTTASVDVVQAAAQNMGGHATLFTPQGTTFAPLNPALEKIHRQVKASFDPAGILNPDRLYEGL